MAFSTRPAKMRTSLGLVAALAIAGFAFAPGAALAQTPPPGARARRAGAGSHGSRAHTGRRPGDCPRRPRAFANGVDQGLRHRFPRPRRKSATRRVTSSPRDGEPLMAVAVYDIEGGDPDEPNQVVRMLMPLGLLLQPGIRFAADQNRPTNGSYAICFPNGCFAEANIDGDVVDQFKAGETLNVSVQNQVWPGRDLRRAAGGFHGGFRG